MSDLRLVIKAYAMYGLSAVAETLTLFFISFGRNIDCTIYHLSMLQKNILHDIYIYKPSCLI